MLQRLEDLKTAGGKFILFAVQQIVDHPDSVSVIEYQGLQSIVLEVGVTRTDFKRVIGRNGRTAVALRELLFDIGGKENQRYHLQVIEPEFKPGEVSRFPDAPRKPAIRHKK